MATHHAPGTDVAPLLGRLYDAALDPALWPAAWAEATAAARGPHRSLAIVADGGVPAALPRPGWAGHALLAVNESYIAAPLPAPSVPGLADIAHHLRRAVQLRARLAMAQTVQAAAAAALAAADAGVLLVSAGARLVYADPAGRRLADLVGLDIGGPQPQAALRANAPDVTAALQAMIHDAAAGGAGGDILLRGPGNAAVAVQIAALPEDDDDINDAAPVMLTLRRLSPADPCPRRVAALFGLTGTEAEIAIAVAAGHTVPDLARTRRVSAATVQAQLRSAMTKVGVPTPRELALVLARLS